MRFGLLVLLLTTMATRATAVRRVLCLHGSGGSAASFLERLAPLKTALGDEFEFTALDGPGGKWWTYPAGERSFSASSYTGAEESIAAVEAELAKGYTGLLGFSQGAMLAALVAARCSLKESEVSLKFAVICGAATPAPYDALLARSRDATEAVALPTLHCLSKADTMNPPELGEALAGCFRHPPAQLLWHSIGHQLPPNEELPKVVAFMEQNA